MATQFVMRNLAEGSVGPSRTSTALAKLDETDSATYQFDIDWQLSPGAGDAFTTELIDAPWDVGLLGARRREQLCNIPTGVRRQVLEVAALSSALPVARSGAALPDRATHDRAANRLQTGI